MDAPLVITEEVKQNLIKLIEIAKQNPLDMLLLQRIIATEAGRKFHLERMMSQTVKIPGPWDFFVTFSIDKGHPIGTCRHMSMSINKEDRVPSVPAVKMIAEILGFTGDMEDWYVYPETLENSVAINVIQKLEDES